MSCCWCRRLAHRCSCPISMSFARAFSWPQRFAGVTFRAACARRHDPPQRCARHRRSVARPARRELAARISDRTRHPFPVGFALTPPRAATSGPCAINHGPAPALSRIRKEVASRLALPFLTVTYSSLVTLGPDHQNPCFSIDYAQILISSPAVAIWHESCGRERDDIAPERANQLNRAEKENEHHNRH